MTIESSRCCVLWGDLRFEDSGETHALILDLVEGADRASKFRGTVLQEWKVADGTSLEFAFDLLTEPRTKNTLATMFAVNMVADQQGATQLIDGAIDVNQTA